MSQTIQEIQLNFAGPIKSKPRGDVYILVAVDRFSKWLTAQICKNTDTRTVLKFFNEILLRQCVPITIAVLKETKSRNSVMEKVQNAIDVHRIYTPVRAKLKEQDGQLSQ